VPALSVTTVVVLGGIVAVTMSGATIIVGGDGVSIDEWAAPLSVWQWAIGGVIEFALIAVAATVWWATSTMWRGRSIPDGKVPSVRPFALGAAVAMIAATVLAFVTHIRNWNEWHTLIAQHPEWHESAQSWQTPVGGAVAVLIVAGIVVGYGFVHRRAASL